MTLVGIKPFSETNRAPRIRGDDPDYIDRVDKAFARAPRIRGDDPLEAAALEAARMCSPHPRG